MRLICFLKFGSGSHRILLLKRSFLWQGFKGHQLHNVLDAPGMADLTADVDFSYLRKMTGTEVTCLGPITQRSFLKNMGIDSRLQVGKTILMSVCFLQKHSEQSFELKAGGKHFK